MIFALIPLMAFLNRVRGGGFGAALLPGHPRFYVAALLAVAVWCVAPWTAGLAAGLAYLAWAFLPWGHLMCLGHYAPDREISKLEGWCLDIAQERYLPALALLHLIGLLPAFIIVSVFAPLFAVGFAGAYWLGWRYWPQTPTVPAELIVGALWGVMIVVG